MSWCEFRGFWGILQRSQQVNSVDGKPVTVVKKNREIHDQNEIKINKRHPQFQDKVRMFIKKRMNNIKLN